MTRAMLSLLPPLLVFKIQQFDDDVLCTNRVTWDEKKKSSKMFYYRPVLFLGNHHLHVAARGIVGNSETVIPEHTPQPLGQLYHY